MQPGAAILVDTCAGVPTRTHLDAIVRSTTILLDPEAIQRSPSA